MFYRPRRRPSSMQVWLAIDSKERTVTLLDVSETGVKIAAPDGLAAGARVALVTPRFSRQAMVRWIRDGQAGLTLDTALSQDEQGELAGFAAGL